MEYTLDAHAAASELSLVLVGGGTVMLVVHLCM